MKEECNVNYMSENIFLSQSEEPKRFNKTVLCMNVKHESEKNSEQWNNEQSDIQPETDENVIGAIWPIEDSSHFISTPPSVVNPSCPVRLKQETGAQFYMHGSNTPLKDNQNLVEIQPKISPFVKLDNLLSVDMKPKQEADHSQPEAFLHESKDALYIIENSPHTDVNVKQEDRTLLFGSIN